MTDPIGPIRAAVAGRYEIEREIGQGAFATVYLARDLRHDRVVAFKVLNADTTSENSELRFLREIRLLAKLQHPNILPLIDSGHAEAMLYYVMPYVKGESLRERIHRERQLPLDTAIAIAREAADALAYAHEQGIIHRDIKPENILLSAGHPMIADFGVARAIDLAGVRQLTRTGVGTPGTPAYMSPEQLLADGPIDQRTDIYSLGCVLYEMVTGKPPFPGRDGFVKRFTEPPPLPSTMRRNLPTALDTIVTKALSRDPKDRYSTATDFAQSLSGGSVSVSSPQRPAPLPSPASQASTGPTGQGVAAKIGTEQPRRHTTESQSAPAHVGDDFAAPADGLSARLSAAARTEIEKGASGRVRATLYAVTALAILVSATAIWGWMRSAPSQPVVRYTLVIDSTEAMVAGTPWSGRLAISPDGSRLAYIGGPHAQLLIRLRNQLQATAISDTEGASSPFFSPNGSYVGFLREKNIQIASLSGGPPITVTDSLTGVAGASWGPDGFIYADGSGYVSLVRVEAKPGAMPEWFTVLDTASGEIDHTWPDALPNGKGVLFTVMFRGKSATKGKTSYSIAVAEIPSGKHRVIVDDAMYARYAASGHLLYVTTNRTLMMVPFDQNSMKRTGEPTALIEGMRLGAFGSADLAISAAGTLVYATSTRQGNQELVWVTRNGSTQSVDPEWQGDFSAPAISPDGKRLAVVRGTSGQAPDIWIKQLDGGPSLKLMLQGTDNAFPTWTPDGQSVTFSSNSAGSNDLWTKRADGSARAVLQFHERRHLYSPRWSPNGKWLIFQTGTGGPGSGDILGIRPGIDTLPVSLVATKFTEISPALSPDGRWLAYTSDESGQYEIYVVPFPNTGAAKWAVSTSGGTEPQWSHSGSELFYRDGARNLVAVEVKTNPTFSVGRSTALFPAAGFWSFEASPQYAVAWDNRRFLMIRPFPGSAADKLIVVENWFEELKARSPK
jgi:eukaryotic-like serine/threonine-protein kinase